MDREGGSRDFGGGQTDVSERVVGGNLLLDGG